MIFRINIYFLCSIYLHKKNIDLKADLTLILGEINMSQLEKLQEIVNNGENSYTELIRLLQEANYLHFEITPIKGTGIKDLNKGKVQDYFEQRGIDIHDYNQLEYKNILINTEIMVETNNEKNMSFAGALFFAKKILKTEVMMFFC